MNLGQTGLLPEKKKVTMYKQCSLCGDRYINEREQGENLMLDQISQIPFDPVKWVEVDENELEIILTKWRDAGASKYTGNIAHALASSKDRWMKVKEKS